MVLIPSRIKIIEQQKNMTEIERYRYVHLYEILLNWHNYDSDIEGETPEEIDSVTKKYLKNGVKFSNKLKDTINQQLEILLNLADKF